MRHVDAYEAARILRVTPELIRQWASRGHISRVGTRSRRALYDPSELVRHAARRVA